MKAYAMTMREAVCWGLVQILVLTVAVEFRADRAAADLTAQAAPLSQPTAERDRSPGRLLISSVERAR
jgi:hypothetical protein